MTVPIKVSFFSRPENIGDYVESLKDWPEGTFVQAGFKGLVVSHSRDSYYTTFVEAFPDDTFIRGEGATLEEAETSAWEKYQTYSSCPGHEWESRGYTNGAGFCKNCNKFAGSVFTGEQLGQHCNICGKGTIYGQSFCQKNSGEWEKDWVCETHHKGALALSYKHLQTVPEEELTNAQKAEFRHAQWVLTDDDDEPISDEEMDKAIRDVLTALSSKED